MPGNSVFDHYTLGDFLRAAAQESGENYSTLSKQCGLKSSSHFSMIVHGKRLPSLELLGRWRDVFAMSDEEFSFAIALLAREKSPDDTKESFFLEKIQNLRRTRYQYLSSEALEVFYKHWVIAVVDCLERYGTNADGLNLDFFVCPDEVRRAIDWVKSLRKPRSYLSGRISGNQSAALRRQQGLQLLSLADQYLGKIVETGERKAHYFRGIFLTIDQSMHPYMQLMFQSTLDSLSQELQANVPPRGHKGELSVYCVGLNMVALTQPTSVPPGKEGVQGSLTFQDDDSCDRSRPSNQRPVIFHYRQFGAYFFDLMSYLRTINPKYSYRWLSKRLGNISAAQLNLIAKGIRGANPELVSGLQAVLKLTDRETAYGQILTGFYRTDEFHQKAFYSEKLANFFDLAANPLSDDDNARFWSDILNPILAEMTSLQDFVLSPCWLKQRLRMNVSENLIQEALEFLINCGLIILQPDGKVKLNQPLLGSGKLNQRMSDLINWNMVKLAKSLEESSPGEGNLHMQRMFLLSQEQLDKLYALLYRCARDTLQLAETTQGSETYQVVLQSFPLAGLSGPDCAKGNNGAG